MIQFFKIKVLKLIMKLNLTTHHVIKDSFEGGLSYPDLVCLVVLSPSTHPVHRTVLCIWVIYHDGIPLNEYHTVIVNCLICTRVGHIAEVQDCTVILKCINIYYTPM